MRIVRSHLDCFTEAIAQVDSAIDTIVVEFENTIKMSISRPSRSIIFETTDAVSPLYELYFLRIAII